jgi:hypothetical protein
MRPFVDMIGLRTGKVWSYRHALSLHDNRKAKMVAKECVTPGKMKTWMTEETEVVRIFVKNFLAVEKLTQEIIRQAAAKYLLVTSRGE